MSWPQRLQEPSHASAVRARPARRELALWALPALAACVAGLPVWVGGFPQGHDWIFELVRTAQYAEALRTGPWPPAWASELYGGYGSPIFLFYAPLFAALSAGASALLGAVQGGCALVLGTLPALAALAAARMVRQLPGAHPAAVRSAASFYALHPYLLGDAWLRNADAEYTALCLAPLALAGALAADRQPRRALLWISAAVAVVVLAHNLSALWLVALCAGASALRLARGAAGRPALLAGLGGIALGLALSAFFWPSALLWVSEVHAEDLRAGKFDFHGNFASPAELFGWSRFFAAGPLTAGVLLALGACLAAGKQAAGQRGIGLAAGGAALLCAVLATRVSVVLWEWLPGLALYQFPWRFAGPLALLSALALGLLVCAAAARCSPRALLALELGVFAACAAQALPRLLEYRPLPAADRERIEAALAPAALLRSPLPATVLDEYLPRAATRGAWRDEPPRAGPLVEAGGADVELLEDRGVRARLRVSSPAGALLRWARWDFPHWSLTADGQPLALERATSGALLSRVPAGTHELELSYAPPLSRRAGTAVSAIALLSWLGLCSAAALRDRS